MGFRKARESARKSVSETAKAVGVSREAVYGWETGKYKPSADMLVKLSEFYGCSIDDLMRKEK